MRVVAKAKLKKEGVGCVFVGLLTDRLASIDAGRLLAGYDGSGKMTWEVFGKAQLAAGSPATVEMEPGAVDRVGSEE